MSVTVSDPVATEGTVGKLPNTHLFLFFFLETCFVMFMSSCIFELKCFCGPLYGVFVPPGAALTELHVFNLDAVHLWETATGTF